MPDINSVCLGVFMDGDDYHIVCVGSESQCKAAIREYGHAHARRERRRDEESRIVRKQRRNGRGADVVNGSFEIQEWPLGAVHKHWSQSRAEGKSFLDSYPYKVLCNFDGDGRERK